MGSFQKFCLRWNNHSSNFVGNLGLLLASEEYSDVTVCCQGEVWHLHQLVLSASSSHFAQLLRLTPPGQTPILILDGPPASDVHALIHFIYHGEVNVDQDSLPSLLRTAASLRIKGLADVTGLTQELNAESFPAEGEIATPVAGLTTSGLLPGGGGGFEEMSPLNLSCNKNHDFKEEQEANDEILSKHPISNTTLNQDKELKRNVRKEASDVFFHPPKRVRTQEPPSVVGPTTVAGIAPTESQTPVTDPVYTPVSSAHLKCKNSSSKSHENLIAPNVDPCPKKDPVPPKLPTVPKQQPVEKVRVLPSKGSTTFYNVPVNASFPLLNMALSPHIAYQQSSTTQASLEVIRSDHNPPAEISSPISNICDLSQTSDIYEHKPPGIKNADQNVSLYEQPRLQPVQDVTTSVAIYSAPSLPNNPVEICSSNISEHQEKLKTEEQIVNQNLPPSSTDIDESNPPEFPEKTFNHKKFSPCTIPNSNPSKKTVHVVRGVYTPHPVTTNNPYRIKNESVNDPVSINNETSVNNFSPEILIQSPSVVKLTPVAVTSYTSNINNTFPTNSIIYTASSGSSFKASENTLPSTPVNASVQSSPKGNAAAVEDKQNVFVQSNPTPQETNESVEVSCSSSTSHPTSVVTSTEGTTPSTQRVTINMRTFKEEWRRQLLVDYDSRTNMSICMLCFTTFKSYDGPRKNTYVKHAKRFHPALEDYSDEERGVIISMYEKYHKYDIDMQKEINKSFRTTNNSGSSLKRVKLSETGLPIPPLNSNHPNRPEAEGESSEERGDSANESRSGESSLSLKETGSSLEGTTGAHSPDKDGFQDVEIPNNNNNNNNLNENNNKRKTEFQQRDTPITS